jgi:hypothetical protein
MADTAEPPSTSKDRLTVGELFPAGDVLGQWVFSLTALAEDLMLGIRPSREAMADGDLRALLFWDRHMATRLYEARRLVTSAREVSEIAEFAGDLLVSPPGNVNLLEAYTRGPHGEPSRVEAMFAQLRHLSVHYSKVGQPELTDTLASYAWLPAELQLATSQDGSPDVSFGWVQAVRSMELFGDVDREDFLSKLRSRGVETGGLASAWMIVALLALLLYVRGRGIDSERLGDVSGWRPPQA